MVPAAASVPPAWESMPPPRAHQPPETVKEPHIQIGMRCFRDVPHDGVDLRAGRWGIDAGLHAEVVSIGLPMHAALTIFDLLNRSSHF